MTGLIFQVQISNLWLQLLQETRFHLGRILYVQVCLLILETCWLNVKDFGF